jgi:hypothetical protein
VKIWWNFAGISQKCSGNDKLSRYFEKKCEKNSENARNFRNSCEIFIFHFIFSFVSLKKLQSPVCALRARIVFSKEKTSHALMLITGGTHWKAFIYTNTAVSRFFRSLKTTVFSAHPFPSSLVARCSFDRPRSRFFIRLGDTRKDT